MPAATPPRGQAVGNEFPQWRRIEERSRHGPPDEAAERQVAHEVEGADGERAGVAAEHLLDPELTPETGKLGGRLLEGGRARRDHRAVDRPGRGTGDDMERGRTHRERGDLADAIQRRLMAPRARPR
jgi:hypothetical protein